MSTKTLTNSELKALEDSLASASEVVLNTGVGTISPENYRNGYEEIKSNNGNATLTPNGYKAEIKYENW